MSVRSLGRRCRAPLLGGLLGTLLVLLSVERLDEPAPPVLRSLPQVPFDQWIEGKPFKGGPLLRAEELEGQQQAQPQYARALYQRITIEEDCVSFNFPLEYFTPLVQKELVRAGCHGCWFERLREAVLQNIVLSVAYRPNGPRNALWVWVDRLGSPGRDNDDWVLERASFVYRTHLEAEPCFGMLEQRCSGSEATGRSCSLHLRSFATDEEFYAYEWSVQRAAAVQAASEQAASELPPPRRRRRR